MKLSSFITLALTAALLTAAPAVHAIGLPLNGGWLELAEEKDTSGKYGFVGEWTWTSIGQVELCVTDLYVPGDTFELYDNGTLLGVTAPFDPLFSGAFAMTPDEAIVDEAFSHSCWLFEPGFHSITIRTLSRPSLFARDGSYVALRAESISVPEGAPGLVGMGMAFAGMAGLRQRQKARR